MSKVLLRVSPDKGLGNVPSPQQPGEDKYGGRTAPYEMVSGLRVSSRLDGYTSRLLSLTPYNFDSPRIAGEGRRMRREYTRHPARESDVPRRPRPRDGPRVVPGCVLRRCSYKLRSEFIIEEDSEMGTGNLSRERRIDMGNGRGQLIHPV